jgi:hypothetical protein
VLFTLDVLVHMLARGVVGKAFFASPWHIVDFASAVLTWGRR